MKILIKILLIMLWVAIGAGAVILMSFARISHSEKKFTGMDVSIDYHGSDKLISAEDLRDMVTKRFGDIRKLRLDELNLEKVQQALSGNPFIDELNIRTTVEGTLVIRAGQPKPLARMISDEKSWLIAENGRLLPYNPRYPVRLPVATGDITYPKVFGIPASEYAKATRSDETMRNAEVVRHLTGIILSDSILNALIEQVDISSDGKVRLFPKTGRPVIDFGDSTNAPEKFENLKAFYKSGLSRPGAERYTSISLRYKNQVVCKK